MDPSPVRRRGGAARATVLALVVVLLLGGAAVAIAGGVPSGISSALPGSDACRVTVGPTSLTLSTEQAERASARVAAGRPPGVDLSPAESRAVRAALTGSAPEALTCDHGAGLFGEDAQGLGPQGLTPRASAVRRAVDDAFGRQRVGGFAPGGVSTGHSAGSAHYDGRAADVFYRPVTAAAQRRGWATAQWLVANAERLDVRTVIYDDRIWTARRGRQGWREYDVDTSGRSKATAAILEHRDHVHVDVA